MTAGAPRADGGGAAPGSGSGDGLRTPSGRPGSTPLLACPRPRRADAEDNRARIIETASATLTGSPGATLQSIAKAAGVGQGTMYRHFPNREALLLAVFRADVDALVDAAPRLLAEHAPVDALRLWLDRLAVYGHGRHAASQAVAAAARGSRFCPPVAGALEQVLAACAAAGRLRPGTHADEVLLLVSFLWQADGEPVGRESTARMLSIVIDGLCATAGADARG
ncbi:TetR/AcrR family transcriptional regulator [Streptomyces sp. NPDC049813]|uniref:TetR/AcrR family transcriptional regulator n=1 Tax=Streptomyces sp. NPDC049813 TaxID=3365597 RepID=UPI003795BD5F